MKLTLHLEGSKSQLIKQCEELIEILSGKGTAEDTKPAAKKKTATKKKRGRKKAEPEASDDDLDLEDDLSEPESDDSTDDELEDDDGLDLDDGGEEEEEEDRVLNGPERTALRKTIKASIAARGRDKTIAILRKYVGKDGTSNDVKLSQLEGLTKALKRKGK